jgi:hypothetical protein
MHRHNGWVALTAAVLVCLLGAGSARAQKDRNPFAGVWQALDGRTKEVVTTVLMLPDGRCKEIGPNWCFRLANFYTMRNGKLVWSFAVTGRESQQVLGGKVKWANEKQFQFDITEGYSGQPYMPLVQERDRETRFHFTRRLVLKTPEQEQKKTLIGQWKCADARTDRVLYTLEFKGDGTCTELAGNLLPGLKQYEYRHGLLALQFGGQNIYQRDMIVSILEWDGNNRFTLEVVGGNPGFAPTAGTKLIYTRQ